MRWPVRWRRSEQAPLGPLHGELLNVEQLEERARGLASELAVSTRRRSRSRSYHRRLADNLRALREAYRLLADDVHRGEAIPPAAEWLLDNFHLVEARPFESDARQGAEEPPELSTFFVAEPRWRPPCGPWNAHAPATIAFPKTARATWAGS